VRGARGSLSPDSLIFSAKHPDPVTCCKNLGVSTAETIAKIGGMSFKAMGNEASEFYFRMGQKFGKASAKARQVVLWVDTFNNYFHPETCRARWKSGDAGFTVTCSRRLCAVGGPL